VDVSAQTVPQTEQRTVALTEIHVAEGFNPRDGFDRSELERLTRSVAAHGVLQPLVVAIDGDGYQLVAGERRYRAAQAAGIKKVPVIVREIGEHSGLDLAVIENVMRQDLDPVEEAKAYQRLTEELGLTRKGVAEQLGVAQKRVTDRLQVLDLPTELHPKVASGEIPLGAIKPLSALAKLRPELAAIAAARVAAEPANEWDEPVAWADVSRDPIGVVLGQYGGDPDDLPSDVYRGGASYPLARFTLDDKAGHDLGKLCKLLDQEPSGLTIRFDSEDVGQAEALGALHRCADGYAALIVGQDVADQLAGDSITRALKWQRQLARQQRETERRNAQANGGSSDDGGQATSEEQAKERRRREREAEQEARRQAAAHNLELGAAVVKAFAKLKLDERVVKILATLNVGGDLDQLAMRGARYGFPGWAEETQTKGGKAKTIYVERRGDAGAKARQYLSVAKTGQEVAGRLLALVAMARYADEGAVAQSVQSYYHLPVPSGLPWTGEIIDLIDALAAERLPDHLTAKKRAERAEQREKEAEREALRRSITERIARGSELDTEELSQLREEIQQAYGRYTPQAHELCERLDELERQPSEQVDAETEASAEEIAEAQ
jgi:ParB/RepB/Spo0J family partition protein